MPSSHANTQSQGQLLYLAPAHPVMKLRSIDLLDDHELLLLACAKTPSYKPYPSYSHNFYRFKTKLETQLREYERFFKGILCGTTESSGSPLILLNQGLDATIKKTIASFLDFPQGEALTWLFEAAVNLRVLGFNPLCWKGAN